MSKPPEGLFDRFVRSTPLILRCEAQRSLEGGLQEIARVPEHSFKAADAAPEDDAKG